MKQLNVRHRHHRAQLRLGLPLVEAAARLQRSGTSYARAFTALVKENFLAPLAFCAFLWLFLSIIAVGGAGCNASNKRRLVRSRDGCLLGFIAERGKKKRISEKGRVTHDRSLFPFLRLSFSLSPLFAAHRRTQKHTHTLSLSALSPYGRTRFEFPLRRFKERMVALFAHFTFFRLSLLLLNRSLISPLPALTIKFSSSAFTSPPVSRFLFVSGRENGE